MNPPPDNRPSNEELEKRFDEHGIPRRRLYPLWYRVHRRLGFRVRPPVLFSLSDHFLHEAVPAAAIVAAAMLLEHWFNAIPVVAFVPIFVFILLVTLWNWWSYKRIRRRLGL